MPSLLVARPGPEGPRRPPAPSAPPPFEGSRQGPLPGSWLHSDVREFRLLIVDDDRLMTDLLPRKLQKAVGPHVRIFTASDPIEAKEIIESQRPHAVVSDYNLRSELDGIDVLEQAAQARPAPARILFSAHAPREIGRRIDGPAVQGYIEKPLRLDELIPGLVGLLEQLTGTDLRPAEGGDVA